ncbi:MAG: hypothetical protein ACE5KT_08550, partial [Methanosarcinales archaeon]
LIVKGLIDAGCNFFAGYPITPATGIYSGMIKAGIGIGAPDEITAIHYVIGTSLSGLKSATATSAPGFLLMSEGIGAAYMMEIPLVVILVQRLGPSTGSATTGAQGDIGLSQIISGGYTIPVICPSDFYDCYRLSIEAVNLAERLRCPVILLTSKEMTMSERSIDLSKLGEYNAINRKIYQKNEKYRPYAVEDSLVPDFLPIGNQKHLVRATASTHDEDGYLQKISENALKNSLRLEQKLERNINLFPACLHDQHQNAENLVISYGITNYAAKQAVLQLRSNGIKISNLTILTLFPVQVDQIKKAVNETGIKRVIIPEENHTGQYRIILQGKGCFKENEVIGVNKIGSLITPQEIIKVFK